MIDIFFLKSWSPISVVKILSIQILPSGSDNLKRAEMRELFPAPVLPTMPTCKEIQARFKNKTHTLCNRPRRNPGGWRWIKFYTKCSLDFSTWTLSAFWARWLLVVWQWLSCALYDVCQNPGVLSISMPVAPPQTMANKNVRHWQMSFGVAGGFLLCPKKS